MTQHTPGPWVVFDRGQVFDIEDGVGNHMARIAKGGWTNDKVTTANAQLIAAAPDFWAAIKLARKALEHDVPEDCWATGPLTGGAMRDLVVCPGCAAIAAIDAAIAKKADVNA